VFDSTVTFIVKNGFLPYYSILNHSHVFGLLNAPRLFIVCLLSIIYR
jgi:hypothetical protein